MKTNKCADCRKFDGICHHTRTIMVTDEITTENGNIYEIITNPEIIVNSAPKEVRRSAHCCPYFEHRNWLKHIVGW